jgi:hypothetical protein
MSASVLVDVVGRASPRAFPIFLVTGAGSARATVALAGSAEGGVIVSALLFTMTGSVVTGAKAVAGAAA